MAVIVPSPVVPGGSECHIPGIDTVRTPGHLPVDIATAKTLVSALLVSAIFLFTVTALRMFVSEISHDLRSVRAQRAAAADGTRAD